MIIDKLSNLCIYEVNFPSIKELVDVVNRDELQNIVKHNELNELKIIPIQSEPNSIVTNNILEAHKKKIDIHITIKGEDIIAFAYIDEECVIHREYDEDNDYSLYLSNQIKTIAIPEGYFCIIPNHFAHMALYGVMNKVRKVVVKLPN